VDPAYPFAPDTALQAADNIQRLLEAFRESRLPVLYTTGAVASRNPAVRGRWKAQADTEASIMQSPDAFAIWPSLEPRPDEAVIVKTYPSAFFGTTLASQLVYYRVDTLVVTGTVTSGCVRGTCLDAFNLNYRVIVPEECVADRGETSHKVALFEIHMKYGDVVSMAAVEQYLDQRPACATESVLQGQAAAAQTMSDDRPD